MHGDIYYHNHLPKYVHEPGHEQKITHAKITA